MLILSSLKKSKLCAFLSFSSSKLTNEKKDCFQRNLGCRGPVPDFLLLTQLHTSVLKDNFPFKIKIMLLQIHAVTHCPKLVVLS